MARTTRVLLVILSLAIGPMTGCGSGGGDSGGGGGVSVLPATRSATLAWADASGPVDGYRVLVSRNGGLFRNEQEVPGAEVTVEADVGDRLRIRVAALGTDGSQGPVSPPSDEILFTETGVVAAASSATSSVGGSVARSTPSAATDDVAQTQDSEPLVPPDAKTRNDFDGDGAADLLWEAAEPGVSLRITSLWQGALREDLAFDRPAGDWWVVGNEDLDGDGREDLLWMNAGGALAMSASGRLAETAPTTPLSVVGQLGADAFVVATGDLDGDGLGDLVVEDEASGVRTVWLHAGDGAEVVDLDVATAEGSRLTASGDFDADGRTDLLVRAADGSQRVHFMNGASSEASLDLPGAFDALATGDFDADGDEDLLRQGPTGAVDVLLMGARQAPVAWSRGVDAGPAWQVGSVGDFDGDGAADVLWLSEGEASLGLYWPEGAAPEYVALDPGDWQLVSFQP